jgi:hypothetical protein
MGIEIIENGLIYDGKKVLVKDKKNGCIINVDGKKIRVNNDQFILLYTFFAALFKDVCSKEDKKKEEVYL